MDWRWLAAVQAVVKVVTGGGGVGAVCCEFVFEAMPILVEGYFSEGQTIHGGLNEWKNSFRAPVSAAHTEPKACSCCRKMWAYLLIIICCKISCHWFTV